MAILGIDEVGRGPWAGPLVVGAVILPEERPAWVRELRDSKQLSGSRRVELSECIWHEAAAVGLGWVWQYEIDEIGIAAALRLATRRAVRAMRAKYPKAQCLEVMIDGTQNFLAGTELAARVTTLVKGDDLIKEISAASIVAKVARDNYMVGLADRYPEYGFQHHKGYGTAEHLAALERYGATPEHRLSLNPLRKILGLPPAVRSYGNKPRKNTTGVGQRAETAVAKFLEREGHTIVERNYKNQFCEIDIVSTKGQEIFFTEVKYRRDEARGGGLEAITPTKQRQMEFAARIFLANHPQYGDFQPLLAAADVGGDDFQLRAYVVLGA